MIIYLLLTFAYFITEISNDHALFSFNTLLLLNLIKVLLFYILYNIYQIYNSIQLKYIPKYKRVI